MANDVIKSPIFDLAVGFKDKKAAAQALKQSAMDDPRGMPDGGLYLNFSGKRGIYELGPDKDDVDKEEIWLVNIGSFSTGWMCWKGGRPLAKRMESIYEANPMPRPDFTEHGPFDSNRGEGWFNAKGMLIRSIDSGTTAFFSTNSKSGVNAMAGLSKLVATRMEEGLPEWPLIQLSKEKFTAQGNTNYKPKFDVYGFLGDPQVDMLGDAASQSADGSVDLRLLKKLMKDSDNGVSDYDREAPDPVVNEDYDEPPFDVDPEPAPQAQRRRAAPSRPGRPI